MRQAGKGHRRRPRSERRNATGPTGWDGARLAHNPEVEGSNPAPATKQNGLRGSTSGAVFLRVARTTWLGGGRTNGGRRPHLRWTTELGSRRADHLAGFVLHDGNRTGVLLRQGEYGST